MGILSPKAEATMRWQSSPLVHHLDAVIQASKNHTNAGVAVGGNKPTQMVVHHASELAILRDEIYEGKRDSLGYELEG